MEKNKTKKARFLICSRTEKLTSLYKSLLSVRGASDLGMMMFG